jgi:large subunit ribosomal protein L21
MSKSKLVFAGSTCNSAMKSGMQDALLTAEPRRFKWRGLLGSKMYAVVVTGGKQYRVSEGSTVVVDRVEAEAGAQLNLDQVLMLGGGEGSARIGTPTVDGVVVKATVVSQEKGAKTEYTRYLHRRRTRKTKNGRARLTVLKIDSISV